MDTLYTFWDNITHYKTESVYFWGLMNSATKTGMMLVGRPKPLTRARVGASSCFEGAEDKAD